MTKRLQSSGIDPMKQQLQQLLIISVSALLLNSNAVSADEKNYLNLSEKLVALRGEVDDLSSELQQLRDEHTLEMRGLLTQKNSIQSLIKQEDTEIVRLQEAMIENKKRISDLGADKESIKESLLLETERLKAYVKSGLPFKVNERLKSIDDYAGSLQADVLSSHKATNTLWSLIEDELKLTRNNGLYRQTVNLDGKEHLAHVAKIGMVMMYFRIDNDQGDHQYGMYKKAGSNWHTKIVTGGDASKVKRLFDALEKQIHIGYFELPNTF